MKTILFAIFCFACDAAGAATLPEQKAEDAFKLASLEEKFAFLLAMPKGGILDEDLAGAIYAESYVGWAAEKGLCIGEDMRLLPPPCAKNGEPAKTALADAVLYRKAIEAWSMRNFSGNGRGHFFEAPGKFALAASGRMGSMLAEAASRAASSHAIYLELSATPDDGIAAELGKRLGWDGNKTNSLENLKNNGIATASKAALQEVRRSETEKDKLLKCGSPDAAPGCRVSIRYLYKVRGDASPGEIFAQLAAGFSLASDPDSKFVGILLAGDESAPAAMRDFSLHMQMLDFLKSLHPKVHVAVDAGELSPGMVPPEGLSFHASEAVMLGHAERIGQGSDILHEPADLPSKLSKKGILLVMCPTRSEILLDEKHLPLQSFLKSGIPVAVSSCTPGILRSEIAMEYLKASDPGYSGLKKMARDSLEYAFIPGNSLWGDPAKLSPASPCSKELIGGLSPSSSCRSFLDASEKARLQWQLEGEFMAFEDQYRNHVAEKPLPRRKRRAAPHRK